MQMRLLVTLVCAAACIIAAAQTPQALADIRIEQKTNVLSINISGTISEEDGRSLERAADLVGSGRPLNVSLNSNGGSVLAAIKIGRIIRQFDL